MEELSKLTAVDNAIKDYLSKRDFTHPFVIKSTNLDREEAIDYVIDTQCGNRLGRYQMVKPIETLQSELTQVADYGYLVKKVYSKSEFEATKEQFVTTLEAVLKSNVPVFIILPEDSAILTEGITYPIFQY